MVIIAAASFLYAPLTILQRRCWALLFSTPRLLPHEAMRESRSKLRRRRKQRKRRPNGAERDKDGSIERESMRKAFVPSAPAALRAFGTRGPLARAGRGPKAQRLSSLARRFSGSLPRPRMASAVVSKPRQRRAGDVPRHVLRTRGSECLGAGLEAS